MQSAQTPDANRARINADNAIANARLRAAMASSRGVTHPDSYLSQDVTPDGTVMHASSLTMTLVRMALESRIDGTWLECENETGYILALAGINAPRDVLAMVAPSALTSDTIQTGRGFYAAYAAHMLQMATTLQAETWLLTFAKQSAARNDTWSETNALRALQGLRVIRDALEPKERSPYGYAAIKDALARRDFWRKEHAAWHTLATVRQYVQPSKLSRSQKRAKDAQRRKDRRTRAS